MNLRMDEYLKCAENITKLLQQLQQAAITLLEMDQSVTDYQHQLTTKVDELKLLVESIPRHLTKGKCADQGCSCRHW